MASKVTMGASSEVFPDLHHKMSKKIAQLTKVIYHLNTRNEDHQSELESLQSNQQYEIQTIIKDASLRIQKFKEIIDINNNNTNHEQLIEKITKKHELEKLQALQDLSNLKNKMKEREKHISVEFQNKYDLLKDDINKMNNKFQERITNFENTNNDLKKQLDEALKNGSSGIKEALERKEKEISDLIKMNNEKYQDMLLEQLKIQEQLRNEMEKSINETKEKTASLLRSDFEKQIGQIRAQLGADKQEALLALRRELEEKMNSQRDDLMSKIEKLLIDIKNKNDDYDRVNDEKKRLVDDLNKQLEEFKKRFSDQVGGKESVINDLTNELTTLRTKNSELADLVIKADEELKKIQRTLAEKNSIINQMETTIETLETEVTRLKGELSKASQAEASLKLQLKKSDEELSSLRNEINQMALVSSSLREDAKKSEKKIQQLISDHEKVVSSLGNDKNSLQKTIDDLKKQMKDINDNFNNNTTNTSNEINSLRKLLEEREQQLKKQLQDQDDTNKRTLEAIKEKHKSEIEILNNSKEMMLINAALKETELKNEIERIIKDNNDRNSIMIDSHNKAVDDLKSKHKIDIDNLNIQISELENQIQLLSDQCAARDGALKGEVQKWEGKTKALMKELEAKKKESERAESVTNGLKNQVESLREELKATQKAYREKMDLSVAKVEADWQAKLDAQIAIHEEDINKIRNEMEASHQTVIDNMIKLHEDQLNVLKNALQKEASSASEEQVRAENEKLRLENLLRIEKEERAAEVAELKSNHNTDMRTTEEAHRLAIENLRNDLSNNASEREKTMIQAHLNETNKLRSSAQLLEDELTQNMKLAVEQANANGEANLKAALAALEQKLNSEREKALSDQVTKHNNIISNVNDKHASEINILNDQLKGTIRSLENIKEESNQLSDQLDKERKERQFREERFVLDKDELMRQCELTVKREREVNEKKLFEQNEEATSFVKQLKLGFNDEKNRYNEALSQAQKDYQELQTRYRNRESRDDDLAKISELEQQMIAKDELVKQTKEEMMYFKREMLNREESYNQKFNRTVNVGVMEVIKTKDATSSKKGGPGQNKPTYAVPPTGGSINGGLGLGVGNSASSSSSSVPGRK